MPDNYLFPNVVSATGTYSILESTTWFGKSCYLFTGVFQVVIIENVAAEGEYFVERSTKQLFDSLPMPVPRKKKDVKWLEECQMLEKSFTIKTSSERAAASAGDDEWKRLVPLIANLLRNYLPHTTNKVQHKISHIIWTVTKGLWEHFLSRAQVFSSNKSFLESREQVENEPRAGRLST